MTRPIAVLPTPVLAKIAQTLLEEHGVRVLEVPWDSSAPLNVGDWTWAVEVPDEEVARAVEVLAGTDLAKWLLVQPQRPQSSR